MKKANFDYLSQIFETNNVHNLDLSFKNSLRNNEKLVEAMQKSKLKKLSFSGSESVTKKFIQYLLNSPEKLDFLQGLESFKIECMYFPSSLILNLLEKAKMPKLRELSFCFYIDTNGEFLSIEPLTSIRSLKFCIGPSENVSRLQTSPLF